ncbi:MAG: PAS domain S-box protein [Spirulinaceae cyanobacterium RM2_2_10]|nr:PAS domain S-box protein [Spirulinaceae cyanobacterium RM2_2_10]
MLANREGDHSLTVHRRQSARDIEGCTETPERRNGSIETIGKSPRRLFENAAMGIFRADRCGQYQEVNTALARLYGYDAPQQLLEDLQTDTNQLYVQPDQGQRFYAQVAQQGCVQGFESEVYRRDGSRTWIAQSAEVVRDAEGELLYYEGFATEIAERRATGAALRQLEQRVDEQAAALETAAAQLEQARTQLIESDKLSSLGELVAGIIHEINNPVNFVCGNLTPALDYVQDLLALVDLYAEHSPQPPAAIANFIEDIDLDFIREDLPKTLTSMQLGTERISQIVRSVRNFPMAIVTV